MVVRVFKRQLISLYRYRRKHRLTKHLSSSFGKRILFLLMLLVLLVAINTVVMMRFEGMGFADSLWLSLTTITTVGYGDFSAQTFIGRASTVLFLYTFLGLEKYEQPYSNNKHTK